MFKQVRKQVFETNSSSSHSLTLGSLLLTPVPFDFATMRAGTVTLEQRKYGWEWARYYTAREKACYLLTQILQGDAIPGGDADVVTAELRENDDRVDLLCAAIEDFTGMRVLLKPGSKGYIDDESVGVGLSKLREPGKLQRLLFCPESYIETGNDNDCPPVNIPVDLPGKSAEPYYRPFYRYRRRDGAVEVVLRSVEDSDLSKFQTATGALLWNESLDDDEPLLTELKEKGIVVQCDGEFQGLMPPYDDSQYAWAMSYLSREKFYFDPAFDLNLKFNELSFDEIKNGAQRYKRVALKLLVPPELADKLQAFG